uniref:ABC transporter ATP-binding protein/permease n=1 Tax=Oribacterium parvum TaxID=1501329 RepID=UPI0028ECFEA3
ASFHASADVKRILRNKIYGKMLALGPSYRESVNNAEIVQMAGEGVEQLETYFGRYLSQFFYSLLAPITLFFILSRISVQTALLLLLAVPLIPIVIMLVMIVAKKLLSNYFAIYYGLGDSFLEKLQGMTTLKIYQADQAAAEDMDREAELFRKITMKVLSMQLNSTSVMDIVAYGGAAVGIISALGQFSKGAISLSGVLMITLLAAEFFLPMRLLGSFFHIGMNGMKASDRIFAFLDLPEAEDGKAVPEEKEIRISMEKLCFSYEESREILRDVELEIPACSFVSLVGLSGSGKSTIAGILMGKNKGYKGSVKLNGRELTEFSSRSILDKMTMIGHDSWIFKGTVRENLLLGKPSATEEEMKEALRKVNLLSFVETQGGLAMQLLSNGTNISGGQKQRLSLARALLHDTPVYIFDEATSNIDAESEEMIMEVIHELAKSRTILLISHRLANVVGSDCIFMLEDGRVTEAGKHEELLKKGGSYSRLFKEQRELERYSEKHKESSAGRHKESFVETQRDTGMEEPGHMEDLQDKTGEREDKVEEGGEKNE